MSQSAVEAIPMVDYLVLGEHPHLVANECMACGARYFDRRNACASCTGTEFVAAEIPTEGEVVSFTIVSRAAPGVPVPFVAATIDCGGTRVRGNVVGVEPDPDHVRLGLKVRLTTTSLGVDGRGVEAIGFGFVPTHASSLPSEQRKEVACES